MRRKPPASPCIDDPSGGFASLVEAAQACRACPRMSESRRVLGPGNGPVPAALMFVGEAPGRFGADATAIPFHGDQAGRNFESLLAGAKLTRKRAFVTNALLCNPRDEAGRNATPTRVELASCSRFLKAQIELVNPRVVVALGAQALAALALIEPHGARLSDVRSARPWSGRLLVPLYHPGQRAMLHRGRDEQAGDYRFVARLAARLRREERTGDA